MFRLNNSKSLALKLNEHFIKKDSKVFLDIQDDMVNNHVSLDKTAVGQDVKELLAEQNARFVKELQSVEEEFREALRKKDEEMAEIMEELRLEHKRELELVST